MGGITGYATGTITGCYNGGAITGNGYVAGIVGQTTKGVTACYNTGSITGAGNYVAGIVAFASGASASVKNCYNRAYVESTGSNVGAVVGMTNNASAAMSNLYYLDFTCSQGIGSAKSTAQTATAKTRAEMDSADFVTTMNTGMAGTFGSSRYTASRRRIRVSSSAPMKSSSTTATKPFPGFARTSSGGEILRPSRRNI